MQVNDKTDEGQSHLFWEDVKAIKEISDYIAKELQNRGEIITVQDFLGFDHELTRQLIVENEFDENHHDLFSDNQKQLCYRLDYYEFYIYNHSIQDHPKLSHLWNSSALSVGRILRRKEGTYNVSMRYTFGSVFNDPSLLEMEMGNQTERRIAEHFTIADESWKLETPSKDGPIYDADACREVAGELFEHFISRFEDDYRRLTTYRFQKDHGNDFYHGSEITRESNLNHLHDMKEMHIEDDLSYFFEFFRNKINME